MKETHLNEEKLIKISIRDTGIGISENKITKILQYGEQNDRQDKSKEIGLRLFVVK